MMKTRTFLSKSVVALALLGTLPAAAGSASYAGALCTPVSGFSTPTTFRSGRILNQTANTTEVVCPVQRNVVAPYFNEDVTVTFTALDPHLTENVCCYATVTEADGTAIATGSGCTSGADAANHKLVSINMSSVFANINGFIALRCVLPGQYTDSAGSKYTSVLASFTVAE
ncbi:MAG: hypothetical protein EOO71_00540 [Myxococcaceae bacterium]|nr:MAG: hypothetical protein EOO71_00540 [Myxococcaceae bacterium]